MLTLVRWEWFRQSRVPQTWVVGVSGPVVGLLVAYLYGRLGSQAASYLSLMSHVRNGLYVPVMAVTNSAPVFVASIGVGGWRGFSRRRETARYVEYSFDDGSRSGRYVLGQMVDRNRLLYLGGSRHGGFELGGRSAPLWRSYGFTSFRRSNFGGSHAAVDFGNGRLHVRGLDGRYDLGVSGVSVG